MSSKVHVPDHLRTWIAKQTIVISTGAGQSVFTSHNDLPTGVLSEMAEKIVFRYNAFEELVGVLQDIHTHTSDHDYAMLLAANVLNKYELHDIYEHDIEPVGKTAEEAAAEQ